MDRSRVSIWTYLVLVFAGGLATGFFADRVYTMRTVSAHAVPRNPEEWKRKYISDVRSRCHLSEAQVEQVGQILDATRRKADALKTRMAPEWEALHTEQVRQVRELMTGPQVAEFEQFRAEREALHRAHSRDQK
jgi:Spy/CpxP family protein refolding chaperone